MDILLDITHNEIIVASFMAWLIAQVIQGRAGPIKGAPLGT